MPSTLKDCINNCLREYDEAAEAAAAQVQIDGNWVAYHAAITAAVAKRIECLDRCFHQHGG